MRIHSLHIWLASRANRLAFGSYPLFVLAHRLRPQPGQSHPLTNNRGCLLLQHVGARSRSNRWMSLTAERRGSHLLTGSGLEPFEPVRPPTACMLLSTFQPLLCIFHRLVVDP